MENNGNIKLKNGNIFWKWKIGNIFPIWNIDISSICQSPSVSLRFSEKSHEKHLHPLFITAFDENKTRESFPFFFFFFFNAIKAADRHRGLAQRGISQSQLIASSFSFFFFFFCSIGSPPAKGFIHPLPSSIGEQWNSTSLLAGVLIATRKFYHWNTVCHD